TRFTPEEIKARKQRMYNVASIAPMIMSVFVIFYYFIYSYRSSKYDSFYESYAFKEAMLMAMTLMMASVAVLLMRYLQTGAFFGNSTKDIGDPSNYIENLDQSINSQLLEQQTKINQLNKLVLELTESLQHAQILDADEKKELVDSLKTRLEATICGDVINELKKGILAQQNINSDATSIDDRCLQTVVRLKQEIAALGWRGNLNLVLGIFTTIIGLFILYVYVSNSNVDHNTPLLVAAYFLPRLSLVILIEVFAYFFLKLYKANLSEIKYFQNELTNVEIKHLALHTSINKKDAKLVTEVVRNLSQTERNFILQKGQSTVEIERTKLDKEALSGALKVLSDITKRNT